jgi:[ribosomal protein S18]-alanine N-acetyltransferase
MKAPAVTTGTSRDIDRIMPVMAAAFDPQFGEAWNAAQCAGMLSMPGTQLYLAQNESGAVIGFALTRCIAGEAELLLLAVCPSVRRTGIGRALLFRVISDVTESGAGRLFLEVRQGNSAIKFYERVGFLQVGRRDRYYRGVNGDYFDSLTYYYVIA